VDIDVLQKIEDHSPHSILHSRTMKKHLLLIIGLVVLAFGGLAYTGNYLQWSSATKVTAKITSTKEQWVRRGENSVNVDIQYPVDGSDMSGTVNLVASTMEDAAKNNEIEVFYLNKNPERVIPVAVLRKKQRAVPVIVAVGAVLSTLGFLKGRKRTGKLATSA
jgi:uncharacterized beta-barrel protein YwiB (DUF1934 family)